MPPCALQCLENGIVTVRDAETTMHSLSKQLNLQNVNSPRPCRRREPRLQYGKSWAALGAIRRDRRARPTEESLEQTYNKASQIDARAGGGRDPNTPTDGLELNSG
jgi:hypothetical protein